MIAGLVALGVLALIVLGGVIIVVAVVHVALEGVFGQPGIAPDTRRYMPAGTVGVTPSRGIVAWLVRAVTRGPVAHAFIATGRGDEIIEGAPGGARYSHATRYDVVYWLTPLTQGMTDAQLAAAVSWAVDHLGTPYSWLDDVEIGLVSLFGWVPAPMRRRLRSDRTLMCSQLVDLAIGAGGRVLFTDGRPAGGVSPNDLYRLAAGERTPTIAGARARLA